MARKKKDDISRQGMIGYGMIIFCVFSAISFISYNSGDPSFSVATNQSATNIFGTLGSHNADFFLQNFGIGAYILIGIIGYWGFLFITNYSIKLLFPRVVLLAIGLCTFCTLIEIFLSYMDFYYEFIPGGELGYNLYHNHISDNILSKALYSIGLTVISFICGFFCIVFDRVRSKDLIKNIGHAGRAPLLIFYPIHGLMRFFRNTTRLIIRNVKSDPIFKIIFQVIWYSIKYLFSKKTRYDHQDKVEMHETTNKIITSAKPNIIADEADIPNFVPKQDNEIKTTFSQSKALTSSMDDKSYLSPSNSLLATPKAKSAEKLDKAYAAKQLTQTMLDFGVVGSVVEINIGPVVSLFEFKPKAGTKSSRIVGLADDIARTMQKTSARISVMQGKDAMAIEIPNKVRSTIYLREVFESTEFAHTQAELPLALGHNIGGEPIIADLAKMPHLLIAGTTGSGKSVGINTMILSLLYKLSPSECKMIMIDPKMLELSVYDGIPHLMTPVITDPKKAILALKWVVAEMESRYKTMSSLGVRNIINYNQKVETAIKNDIQLTRKVDLGYNKELGRMETETIEFERKKMPYIVVIVDEMADLMITAGKEVEAQIQRLAQMARASGIHIIMATQRPSVDVITGVIKANFPSRISFQVTSKIDSRTILGEMGAEQLLGQGDMLFMQGGSKTIRVHGPFVADQEVQDIVTFLKENNVTEYIDVLSRLEDGDAMESSMSDEDIFGGNEGLSSEEKLYQAAIAVVMQDKKSSISYLQRKLRIGYNKSANLIERMERDGVLASPDSKGNRMIIKGMNSNSEH